MPEMIEPIRNPGVGVLYGGGTIATGGSAAGELSVTAEGLRAVQDRTKMAADRLGIRIVHSKVVFSGLSENMEPRDWTNMALGAKEAITEEMDGLALSMGTDTVEYALAALNLALPNLHIPFVATGAMENFEDENSDAPDQLDDALFVTAYSNMAGVYHVFDSQIIDGTHLHKLYAAKKVPWHLQRYMSVNVPPIGYVIRARERQISHNLFANFRQRTNFHPVTCYPNFDTEGSVFTYTIDPGFSGVNYVSSALETGAKCIMLQANGENFLSEGSTNQNMQKLLKAATKKGVPVFLCPKLSGYFDLKSSALGLRTLGLVPLFDTPPSTAFVKALWVLQNPTPTNDPVEIIRRMLTNYVGELNTPLSDTFKNVLATPYRKN